jgi:hypothetical protein
MEGVNAMYGMLFHEENQEHLDIYEIIVPMIYGFLQNFPFTTK